MDSTYLGSSSGFTLGARDFSWCFMATVGTHPSISNSGCEMASSGDDSLEGSFLQKLARMPVIKLFVHYHFVESAARS